MADPVEIKDPNSDVSAQVGANGLEVDVKALPALPSGTNNIGKTDAQLDNDWNYTPVSTSAGANLTNLSLVAAGAVGTTKYITGFELVVTAASPTADIIVKLLNGSGGTVIWQTAIGAGAPIGTRVGFAMARGIPVTAATGIFLTTTGNTGSPVLTPSACGYTK